MTHSPAPAAARGSAPAAPAPRAPRSEPAVEPPRRQAESRSARDRFAARLERESPSAANRSHADNAVRDDAAGAGRAKGGEERQGTEQDGGEKGQQHGDLVQAQLALAGAIDAVRSIAPLAAAGAPAPLDTAMLERMAAQIAEGWPTGASEAATITFPDTALATSAHLVRAADGSLSVTIAGLDPALAPLQNARLQIELANALARRRLRVRSLQFESGSASQRRRGGDPGGSLSGTTAAIPRAV